jgi:hypothetical protein
MGMRTDFLGTLTTSRPLTPEELEEYNNCQEQYEELDMYLMFVSNNELIGPNYEKVCGYMDMEEGFMKTLNWLKSKGIILSGRINYVYEDVFSDVVGGGFGAFVATPENVTYYKLDFTNLKMVSSVIYSKSV